MSRQTWAVIVGIAAAFSVVAIWAWVRGTEAARAAERLDAERTRWEANALAPVRRSASTGKTYGTSETKPRELPATRPVAAPPVAVGPPPSSKIFQEDPELLNLQLKAKRLNARVRFEPFFRELGRSDADLERFVQIELERQEQIMDVMSAVSEGRLSPQDPSVGDALRTGDEQFRKELRVLLGGEGYERYENHVYDLSVADLLSCTVGPAALHPSTAFSQEELGVITRVVRAHARPRNPLQPELGVVVDWPAAEAGLRTQLSHDKFRTFQNVEAWGFRNGGTRSGQALHEAMKRAHAKDAETRAAKETAGSG